MPKVSVIISTYNRPEKLKKAIDSVIAQTFKDWELIVVDDHSDVDPHLDLYDLQCDLGSKFTLIVSPVNSGSDTKPKNTGILASRGDYIAFLDDDNTFRPDHLAVLVKELESNPQVAMVYGQRMVIDDDGKQPASIGTTSEYMFGKLLIQNYIDTSDVLVRRQALFGVGGFDEEQKKYIDWNLWLRMEKYGHTFKQVPYILTDYHMSSDNKSLKVMTDAETRFMEENHYFKNIPDWDAYDCIIELPYLGEVKEPRIAIFSLTYDRLEYTKKCFESMYKTAGYKFTHFVIDNGSTDETPKWLNELDHPEGGLYTTFNKENKGISIASNQALKTIDTWGPFDIIVKVDNDAYFLTDGWLKEMVEIWKRFHKLALSCFVQGLRDNPGGAPRYGYKEINKQLVGLSMHLGGICTFVDARAYQGWRWPEDSFLHGVQDREFSTHLNESGYGMGYLENHFLEHVDGTQGQEDKYPEYFLRRKTEKSTKYGSN